MSFFNLFSSSKKKGNTSSSELQMPLYAEALETYFTEFLQVLEKVRDAKLKLDSDYEIESNKQLCLKHLERLNVLLNSMKVELKDAPEKSVKFYSTVLPPFTSIVDLLNSELMPGSDTKSIVETEHQKLVSTKPMKSISFDWKEQQAQFKAVFSDKPKYLEELQTQVQYNEIMNFIQQLTLKLEPEIVSYLNSNSEVTFKIIRQYMMSFEKKIQESKVKNMKTSEIKLLMTIFDYYNSKL